MIKIVSWLALIVAVSANVTSNTAFKMAVSWWNAGGDSYWWALIVDPVLCVGLGLTGVLLSS